MVDGAISFNDFKYFTPIFKNITEKPEKIDLIIETFGGSREAAAKLVYLCREYCSEFNVID